MAVVCCWSRVERKTASVLFKNKLKPIQAAAPAESSPSMHRFQVSTICLHHEIWHLFESYWIELSCATATTNHTHLGRHNVQICRDDPKPTETKYREARSIHFMLKPRWLLTHHTALIQDWKQQDQQGMFKPWHHKHCVQWGWTQTSVFSALHLLCICKGLEASESWKAEKLCQKTICQSHSFNPLSILWLAPRFTSCSHVTSSQLKPS